MNVPASITRTLISRLRPTASRSTQACRPPTGRPWPETTSLPTTDKSHQARVRLVASTLRLSAAAHWEDHHLSLHSQRFNFALNDYMAEATPPVMVTHYNYRYDDNPRDKAYLAIQKAALNLAAASWGNGRETAGDSADLDYADDLLDDALRDYIDAARSE